MTGYTRLRELAEAATPGPWDAYTTGVQGGDHWYVIDRDEAIIHISAQDGSNEDEREPLARYVAAVDPSTVLALLDELKTFTGRYEQMVADRDALQTRIDAALAYVDDPGNWGTYDGRRRVLRDLLSTPVENGEEQ